MQRCPSCGAIALEDVGHLLRCGQCLREYDRRLRPYGPLRSDPRPRDPISEESMPTMVADVTPTASPDQTYIDLDDQIPTDPVPRAQFAAPPPPSSPFAAPPPASALARDAVPKKYAYAVGDGGPPVGLDLLVLVLFGLDVVSLGLWWRSNLPLKNAMLLPLVGSILVTYFFWKGRNWARFVILLGSIVEIVLLGLGFAMLRRQLTGIEMLVMAISVVVDAWVVWFAIRPDSVAFFEKRRR